MCAWQSLTLVQNETGTQDAAQQGSNGSGTRGVSRASEAIRGEDHHGMGTAAALLIGIGVGVGVGMLLAPASGEQTRSNLSNRVQEFGDRVRDKFSEGRREPSSGTYGS